MSQIQVTVEQHDRVGVHKPSAFVPLSVNEKGVKLIEDRGTSNDAYKFYEHRSASDNNLIGSYIVGVDTIVWCARQSNDDTALIEVKDDKGVVTGYIADTDKFTVNINKSEYSV